MLACLPCRSWRHGPPDRAGFTWWPAFAGHDNFSYPALGLARCRAKLADGLFAVGRGLIDVGHLGQRPIEHLNGEMVRHFPGVEADAVLVIDLIIEKIAHRTDLTGKA